MMAVPATLPSVASVPGAIPTLTVMAMNGAVNIIIAVLLLVAGWVLAGAVGRWVRDMIGRTNYVDPTLKPLVAASVHYLILALTVVAVLGQFGVQTTSLIALLGAAGLAIGLALQGTLSNVASGVMLLVLRPFRVFDRVKITDVSGTVREIGLFRTEIVTDDGNFVSIPNATIFSGTIVNMSRESTRRTDFTVEVDRGENLDRVQKRILECLTLEQRVLKAPAPTVEIDVLGPISTTVIVKVWLDNRDFGATLSEVKKRVRHALQHAEVSAPIPVPAPAVQPWHPEAQDKPAGRDADKPN
jgi:small conductance mechanosensitive channel